MRPQVRQVRALLTTSIIRAGTKLNLPVSDDTNRRVLAALVPAADRGARARRGGAADRQRPGGCVALRHATADSFVRPADADLAVVLTQVRDQIENGPASPATDVMLDEYVRWHVVKAVLVGLLAAVLIGLSVVAWRRHRLLSLLTAVPAVAALVVVAANVTTAANPIPPFLLLQGSW